MNMRFLGYARNDSPRETREISDLAWYWYLAVFATVVLFRLICLADFVVSPYFVPIGGDRALYHNLAVSIFRHEWFPDVISFMPLYPVLLGLLYKIIGAPNLAAAVCQSVFDTTENSNSFQMFNMLESIYFL